MLKAIRTFSIAVVVIGAYVLFLMFLEKEQYPSLDHLPMDKPHFNDLTVLNDSVTTDTSPFSIID